MDIFLTIMFRERCLFQCDSSTDDTIYNYHAKTLNGSHTVNFSEFRGKAVLFINVATY
uniref:Glutathione peroxidase n=1 Tax=Sphaeramia orbicularis TaxID=375764 RepID=A0A673BKL8_9TELE